LKPIPARRVRLKLVMKAFPSLHPSDIAEHSGGPCPAERESVFGSLDEDVAADALEEIDPKCRSNSCGRLIPTKPPTLWKRWTPTTQPTCWGDLPQETSEEILEEMEPEERQEVSELLAFEETRAAGHNDHGIHRPAPEAPRPMALTGCVSLRAYPKASVPSTCGSQ